MYESVIYQDILHEGQAQGLEQGSVRKAQEIAFKIIKD
jgi:predicted transposase YdaD